MAKAYLEICGTKIAPGEKVYIKSPLTELADGSILNFPLILIKGAKDGSTLYLQACVHGDEVNGAEIIRQVVKQIKPEELAGSIVAAPIVNVPAYLSKTRGFILEERGPIDMNRIFPGSKDGLLTERIAFHVFNELLLKSDAAIDFHAALAGANIYPFTYVDPAEGEEELLKKREALAKVFGSELIYYHHVNERWHRSGFDYTFAAQASKHGVPCITAEAGESNKLNPPVIEKGVQGVFNVMMHLGMIPGTPVLPNSQVCFDEHPAIRANHGGIIKVHVEVGQRVKAGDLIAEINNIQDIIEEIYAPYDCIILRVITAAAIYPGAEVAWLINLSKTKQL